MRRFALLALPLGLLLIQPAAAQHWNDSGPGRDLLSSTVTDFENFRQRAPAPPSFSSGASGTAAPAEARGPIPLLDWVPPPPVPLAAPTTTRRSSTARRARRAPVRRNVVRDTAPLPAAPMTSTTRASAPAPAAAGGDWERSLAQREQELERLRRVLEDDRLRYQQGRQPQLQ
jgi:hypothetical protein